jgi:hypothetical protein
MIHRVQGRAGMILLGLIFFWTLIGCSTVDKYVDKVQDKLPSWAKSDRPKTTYHYHKVRWPGETLSIIAEWYTGDIENWRALAKANRKLDPGHIKIGTKIRIPRKLLRTSKPLPRDFVAAVEKRRGSRTKRVAKNKPPPQTRRARPRPTYHYHKVRWLGESLSVIAKWYTGDGENWRVLAKANPRLDPGKIKIGAKIRVPRNLMHTQKPLPRAYVVGSSPKQRSVPPPPPQKRSRATKPKPREAPSSSNQSEEEELDIFGPK